MSCRLLYSSEYDLSLLGLERLHPFDSRKFSRAWGVLRETRPGASTRAWVRPTTPVTDEELELVHSPEYLNSLRSSATVARILEIWAARLVPNGLLETHVLTPMRLAVRGTIMATECALKGEAAMNFGGGQHHAFRDRGAGFCVYADVAVAIATHRRAGLLGSNERVAIIDLDAHRGNGLASIFLHDETVSVFDVFNFQVYPGLSDVDLENQPFMIPIRSGIGDTVYLDILKTDLPRFLDTIGSVKVAFYNAGTDIVVGDRLGRLNVSPQGVAARDRLVVDMLASRGIPMVVVTSGGYTEVSHKLVAELGGYLLDKFG